MNPENRDPIIGDAAEAETAEPRIEFRGEDAEVSVMRSGDEKKGILPWKEGGWRVLRDYEKDPNFVVVGNDKNQSKPVNRDALSRLQKEDFINGSKFSMNGKEWIIIDDLEAGGLSVGLVLGLGAEEGADKRIEKSQFIEAKIAEISKSKAALELEQKAILELDPGAVDRDKLTKLEGTIAGAESQLRYWQAKLNTRKQLIKESDSR